nr:glypican-5-like [Chrysemys picta bellii]
MDVVNARGKQHNAKLSPYDQDWKKLDLFGKKMYSLATLQFRVVNYEPVMARYDLINYGKLSAFLEHLSETQKEQFQAVVREGHYTHRVVGNGVKAQSVNPEVKVKGTDPVINQIIDKLKHIIQRLQGKSFPKHEKWGLLQTGSGVSMDEQVSGDCDDEDGCGGSGSGEVKRILQIADCKSHDSTATYLSSLRVN